MLPAMNTPGSDTPLLALTGGGSERGDVSRGSERRSLRGGSPGSGLSGSHSIRGWSGDVTDPDEAEKEVSVG